MDLDELVFDLASKLDPYSSKRTSVDQHNMASSCDLNPPSPSSCSPTDAGCSLGVTRMPKSVAKPVISSRIKWEHSPNFDPTPYLVDPVVKDAFVDPARVRLPSHMWPEQPLGRVHCSKQELLGLACKWDSKGACRIFRLDEINWDEAVGLFAVPKDDQYAKDDQYDRLILNPQTVNSRMQSFSHYTKQLAPGSMFSLIHLKPGCRLRISADDLAEMYYTVRVPTARAKRNCIGKLFDAAELKHLSCFDSSKHYGPCVLALSALAMGDSWAVEIAQQAHCNVLRFLAGSMLDSERVCYRHPFPRSDFMEWLSIDDHIGIQVVTDSQFRNRVPLRDTAVFLGAERAYQAVKLVQHPKKKQREVSQGVFLGAEVDGTLGFVSAPRHRISVLMMCTVLVARRGTASRPLLASLLGCWIHVLMFRRAVLAVVSHAFTDGIERPQNQIFPLSRETRNELLALSCLGPVCMSDLRVGYAPFIFCTDASPDGAGICQSPECESVVQELWRHSELRGYYTQLLTPAASVLSSLGESFEEPIPSIQPSDREDVILKIPCSLSEGILFDCIELFRGEGNWSLAHEAVGFRVHDGFDVDGRRMQFGDLLDDSTFHQAASLAARGVISDWHAGTPCKTYGTLRRPRLRSKQQPAGFDMWDPLTREHTLLALRTAFLMNLVMLAGGFFSVEQPGSSVMFYLDVFQRMVFRGCIITHLYFCAYGSPFKKPSKWLHNKPWMLGLEQSCRCSSSADHFVIEGTFTHASVADFAARCRPSPDEVYGRWPKAGEHVSAFSAAYPKLLCARIASGAIAARHDSVPIVPISAKTVLSFRRIGIRLDLPRNLSNLPAADPRPFHEDPEWIEELPDSLPFRELLRYRFKKRNHINVLECRVHKTLLKHCAKNHPNNRILSLLDSRVTLGATSKGRSSSRAICRVLQGSLGYVLGGCLYPGGFHIASGKNRSDAPSRNRPVPAPTKEIPTWLCDLRSGGFDRFDRILESAKCTKLAARWLRFLLLLAGDIERNPGPGFQTKPRTPRGQLSMDVGFATATSKRMQLCLDEFAKWLFAEFALTLQSIGWDYTAGPLALRAYGLHLFAGSFPRYKFVYTITAMQDTFPHLRPFFSSAWQVDRKWQQYEPGHCRPVLSAPIMRAVSCLCLIWKWYRWLGITLIGFLGMLHPAEFISLLRSDLLLPGDTLNETAAFYVHIRNPKTARFARKQHCKIDDPCVLAYVTKVFGALAPNASLFAGGTSAYRRRWDHVPGRLGISVSMPSRGATPAVLRGSGATALYLESEDLSLIQWRGRWAQLKTVEHYIQEVAAQSLLAQMPPEDRAVVKFFADTAGPLLHSFLVDKSKQ